MNLLLRSAVSCVLFVSLSSVTQAQNVPYPRSMQSDMQPPSSDDVAIAAAWEQEDYVALVGIADRRLRAAPTDNYARMLRGMAHYSLDDYDAAISDESAVLETVSTAEMAFQIRGASYYQKDEYFLAIRDETEALRLVPTAFAYGYRGASEVFTGNAKSALADLDAALAISPDDEWSLSMRGGANYVAGNYRAALQDENRALAIDPKDALGLSVRGQARYALADYRGAIRDETDSIAHEADGVSLETRGFAELSLGRFADAAKDERSAIALGSGNYQAYLTLANASYAGRKYADALGAYRHALAFGPNPKLKLFVDRLQASLARRKR